MIRHLCVDRFSCDLVKLMGDCVFSWSDNRLIVDALLTLCVELYCGYAILNLVADFKT